MCFSSILTMKGFYSWKKVREFLLATFSHVVFFFFFQSAELSESVAWDGRGWESEGHLWPCRLPCGNSVLPSVRSLMAPPPLPPSLPHGGRLFGHRPPKVNHLHPPSPPSSIHTNPQSWPHPPRSPLSQRLCRKDAVVFAAQAQGCLLGFMGGRGGGVTKEAATFTRQNRVFKNTYSRRKRKGSGVTHSGTRRVGVHDANNPLCVKTLHQPVLSCTYLIQIPRRGCTVEDKKHPLFFRLNESLERKRCIHGKHFYFSKQKG